MRVNPRILIALALLSSVLLSGGQAVRAQQTGTATQNPGAFASGVEGAASQGRRPVGSLPQHGGPAIYQGICQGCHMPDAKGACGAGCYPALAANPVLSVTDFVTREVVNGNKGMPAFGRFLTDQQIADVINYLRTHFGNHYQPSVTPADVEAARHQAS